MLHSALQRMTLMKYDNLGVVWELFRLLYKLGRYTYDISFVSFADVYHMYDPKCGTYVKSNRKTNVKYDFRVLVILWIKKKCHRLQCFLEVADHM